MSDALMPTSSMPALESGRSRLCGAEVVSSVILQFRTNFLLNELDERSVPPTVDIDPRLLIPGFAPRRREDTVEMVHQARVSVRRMRSTIRIFAALLDDQWAEKMSNDLSWYGDVLGRVRDLTVMRERILDGELPIRSLVVRDALATTLDAELTSALAAQDDARHSMAYFELIGDLLNLEERISFTPLGYGSARRVLPPQLDDPWRELSDAVRVAEHAKTAKNLHAVRIRAKRIQHGCEAVALVLGKPVHRSARAAESLQRRLGTVHDASVCQEWLSELVERRPDVGAHLEQLSKFEQVEARLARRGWKKDVAKLEDRWRRWH